MQYSVSNKVSKAAGMTAGVAVWDNANNQVVLSIKTPSGAYRHLILKDYEMVYADESYNTLWTVTA